MPYIFFAENDHGSLPIEEEDDIDQLFRRLPKIQPPSILVSRIMSSVSQLPKDQQYPLKDDLPSKDIEESTPWTDLDGLVVRKENTEP